MLLPWQPVTFVQGNKKESLNCCYGDIFSLSKIFDFPLNFLRQPLMEWKKFFFFFIIINWLPWQQCNNSVFLISGFFILNKMIYSQFC